MTKPEEPAMSNKEPSESDVSSAPPDDDEILSSPRGWTIPPFMRRPGPRRANEPPPRLVPIEKLPLSEIPAYVERMAQEAEAKARTKSPTQSEPPEKEPKT